MKQYGLLFSIILTMLLRAGAQVQIQPTLPTAGLVQKNQLWNLVALNGNPNPVQGKFELVIRDRASGIELMTATTTTVTIPKGSAQLNVNTLNPIQYNFLGMEPDKNLNGLLPAGAYIACYAFTGIFGHRVERLAEECIRFDVEPLSPPMLAFPSDSSVLEIPPSQFTWTPPAPASMFNRLRYEMLITEIRPGQKAAEALQDNISFYSTAGIAGNLQTYPAALTPFEKEKWYAWQIIARDDRNYAGHSEAWVFKVKQPDSVAIRIETPQYILLSNTQEKGLHQIRGDNLYIKYYSFEREHETTIRFLTTEGKLVQEVKQKILYGDNFLHFPLKRAFVQEQTYIIELTDLQNGRHAALFSIHP